MKIPIIKNTVTNYLSMAVRLLQGILVTRWLLADLGEEYYGLWALLWSFFCYSLLLDFGFGVTAQKYTSIGYYRTDLDKYNRILSTVFCFHALMSLVIAAGTILASFFVETLFNLQGATQEKIDFCRQAFLIFGIGSALLFPTGICPEILIGLQKIYMRNYLTIASKLAELIGILIIFSLRGNFMTLIYFTLGLNALTNLGMWFYIRRAIPGIRLRLKIDRDSFRELFRFSGFVYLCSVARLLWDRGSALFISIFCGLADVGFFQLGGRLPTLMNQLTGPYQENVSPMAATYYFHKKHKILSTIILNSMRWNSFLATGMMVGIFIFAPELMRFLFKFSNDLSVEVCRWMVVSLYITLVFRSIPERFLLMAERHKLLSWVTLTESGVYVLACLILLQHFPITCVVWSALTVKVASLLFVIGPVMLRYLPFSLRRMLWEVSIKPLCAALPLALLGVLLEWRFAGQWSDFTILLLGGGLGGIGYLGIFFFGILSSQERQYFMQRFGNRFFRKLQKQ